MNWAMSNKPGGKTDGHLHTCCMNHGAPSSEKNRGACNIAIIFCQAILFCGRFFLHIYKRAGVPYSVHETATPRAP